MNRTNRYRNETFVQRGVLSVKIISVFLVCLLVIGTMPATHSYPGAKANFNNFWLAAQEFWGSLEFFNLQQREEQVTSVESNDIVLADSFIDASSEGVENLKNHPVCRSFYVSEYLPTFSSHVIEKCEKAIKSHEQKLLFNTYVEQLCLNPGHTVLSRKQLGEIQLRLRKYALTFPQSNIEVSSSDIDGLYGEKTCQIIANYQIISNYDVIDGEADSLLYNDLIATIPLTEVELAGLSWQKTAERVVVDQTKEPSEISYVYKSDFELPNNPFKRIAFCLRNRHIKQCDYSNQNFDLAKTDMNHR